MKKIVCYKAIIIILIAMNVYLGVTSYVKVSSKYTPAPIPVLTEENKANLNKYAENIRNFVGIFVVSTDIQSNSTQVVYMNILDPVVNSVFSSFINDKAISNTEPLFVKNGDNINSRLVSLINHEFVCTSFADTISSRFLPEIASYVSVVCSISIPPSFGEFNGMINVYLNKQPTAEDIDIIRSGMREMSQQLSENLKPKN